jgi:RimJ/RimL family protein N-acetyltransferase
MRAHVDALIGERAHGRSHAFATRRLADGRIVGSTRFLTIARWDWSESTGAPDAVEIGGTWLAASAQRSAVNTEAKLLMLTHAFEAWRVQRVELKTDAANARSRAAIERIGATFEGVLRNYQPSYLEPGRPRDTAMFSVTAAEWPAVRSRLEARARVGSGGRAG